MMGETRTRSVLGRTGAALVLGAVLGCAPGPADAADATVGAAA
ncbi:hypothetical protein [Nonomuraea sp. NPDC049758]